MPNLKHIYLYRLTVNFVSSNFPTTFQLSGAISGRLGYYPGRYGPAIVNETAPMDNTANYTGQIVVLNAVDFPFMGCNGPLNSDYASDGVTPLAGKIVLIEYRCFPTDGSPMLIAKGVKIILLYYATPTVAGLPNYSPPGIWADPKTPGSVPHITLAYEDADIVDEYIGAIQGWRS